jgi:hypothetical protein
MIEVIIEQPTVGHGEGSGGRVHITATLTSANSNTTSADATRAARLLHAAAALVLLPQLVIFMPGRPVAP